MLRSTAGCYRSESEDVLYCGSHKYAEVDVWPTTIHNRMYLNVYSMHSTLTSTHAHTTTRGYIIHYTKKRRKVYCVGVHMLMCVFVCFVCVCVCVCVCLHVVCVCLHVVCVFLCFVCVCMLCICMLCVCVCVHGISLDSCP